LDVIGREETNIRVIKSKRRGWLGHVVCMRSDKIHETILSKGMKERMLFQGPGLCRITAVA
jgi:hypothetical protein